MSDVFARPPWHRATGRPRPCLCLSRTSRGIPGWVVAAFLLGTIARDALGDPDTAGRALQSALDLAEPDQVLFSFLIDPPPGLFDRHTRHHILGIGQYHAEHARGHL